MGKKIPVFCFGRLTGPLAGPSAPRWTAAILSANRGSAGLPTETGYVLTLAVIATAFFLAAGFGLLVPSSRGAGTLRPRSPARVPPSLGGDPPSQSVLLAP